ncbi:hypothetical protein C8K15_10779 [Paenisporosarcina sp. OV554]|nr:hypothetical protein C8K15_10779 [Paenisporosarcina sp. OV554]
MKVNRFKFIPVKIPFDMIFYNFFTYSFLLHKTPFLKGSTSTDHPLAMGLWEMKNIDAQFLAVLIMDPNELSKEQIENMVDEISYTKLVLHYMDC